MSENSIPNSKSNNFNGITQQTNLRDTRNLAAWRWKWNSHIRESSSLSAHCSVFRHCALSASSSITMCSGCSFFYKPLIMFLAVHVQQKISELRRFFCGLLGNWRPSAHSCIAVRYYGKTRLLWKRMCTYKDGKSYCYEVHCCSFYEKLQVYT